jgi:hypothetical protein
VIRHLHFSGQASSLEFRAVSAEAGATKGAPPFMKVKRRRAFNVNLPVLSRDGEEAAMVTLERMTLVAGT